MSKMTMLVGPPLERGISDSRRARVTAVATSPSASTCTHPVLMVQARHLQMCYPENSFLPEHAVWWHVFLTRSAVPVGK